MAKSKELKTGSKTKSEVQTLKTVKNAAITKPSQTPLAKSKAIAKETAAKVSSKKKAVKAATPSSSESESESEDSASDSSESEEESPAKTNGKANGVSKKVEPESESDSSESSDSSSDDDSDASETENATAAAAADSDESDDSEANSGSSDDSESEEESAPVAAVKKAVNGAAKVVAKATETDSDSSESSSEEDSSDSDEEEEEAAPSKKRKAEADTEPAVKKAKVEGGEEIGSKNLFVGNLSWNVDDEWLLQEFKEFGEIAGARVISDKATGRSKGFGYVEFTNAADAAAALRAKKGALIDGREANVDFSTPRDNNTPRERAQGRAQQYGDTNNPPSDTLFLGNLSFDADENIVGEAFGVHGTVVNVRLPTDQETGNPKGFGYITFASVDECKAAFEAMAGAEIAGRPVRLDYATPRPDRGDGGRGGARGGRGRGRGGFGDRVGRGGARGGARGGRAGSTNRGGFGDFKGKKQTF